MASVPQEPPGDQDESRRALSDNHGPGEPEGNAASATACRDELVPSDRSPGEGRVGDYQLLEEIGRGGMGVVYKARQVGLNRIVAVKMIVAGQFASKAAVMRLRAEAEAAGNLTHPNIVAVHETGEYEGRPYFSMDFVDGRNLEEWVRTEHPSPQTAARLVRKIAEAVQCAHDAGILHRDLKPSNVLLDRLDEPKVTDFGLAKRFRSDSELTVTGQLLGSPNFMPPEQASGKLGRLDVRSDVHAIGATLFFLLTGRPPYQAATVTDTLQQLLHEEPVAPRLLNPSVPIDLQTICLKCLEKEPQRRYATAKALEEDLGRFINGEPLRARPVGRWERLGKWCRRKPLVASLGVAALVMFFGILVGSPVAITTITHSRSRAEAALAQARLNEYSGTMTLAQRLIDRGRFGLARQYLEQYLPEADAPDLRGFEWHYFWRETAPEFDAALAGHDDQVRTLAFSPDGKQLASLGGDQTLSVWDVATRTLITSREQSRAESIAYLRDGKTILIGCQGLSQTNGQVGQVYAWNLSEDSWEHLFDCASAQFAAAPHAGVIAVRPRLIAAISPPFGDIELWEVESRRMKTLSVPGRMVAFSPDERLLATENKDHSIRIWDWRRGEVVHRIATDKAENLVAMAFSSDGRTLVFSNPNSPSIYVCDLERSEVTAELRGHTSPVRSISFSVPEPHLFVSASSDHSVILWDLREGRQVSSLRGHSDRVGSVAFSPDGSLFASCGEQREILLWNVRRVEHTNDSPAQDRPLPRPHAKATPYGRASAYGRFSQPILSPDGEWLAVRDTAGRIEVRDLRRGDSRNVPGADMTPIWFSEDGRVLATFTLGVAPSEREPDIRHFLKTTFWEMDGFREIESIDFSAREEGVFYATVSHRATYLAASMVTMARGPRVRLWRIEGSTNLLEIAEPIIHFPNVALAVSSRGVLAMGESGSKGYRFRCRDPQTGREWTTPEFPASFTTQLVYTPDEQRLVSSDSDGTLRIWSAATGAPLGVLNVHNNRVTRFDVSPDGRTLASMSDDESMIWWNLATRRPVALFDLAERPSFVAFSRTGEYLALGIDDRLRLFLASPAP